MRHSQEQPTTNSNHMTERVQSSRGGRSPSVTPMLAASAVIAIETLSAANLWYVFYQYFRG